jgi:hypothetical protein
VLRLLLDVLVVALGGRPRIDGSGAQLDEDVLEVGPLDRGDELERGGRRALGVEVDLQVLDRRGHVLGEGDVGEHVGTGGLGALGHRREALGTRDEGEERLGRLRVLGRGGDVDAVGQPHRQPVGGGVVAREGEEADVLEPVGVVRLDLGDPAGEEGVVDALTAREIGEGLLERRGDVVVVDQPVLRDLLDVLEGLEGGGVVGEADLVGGVLLGEVRVRDLDVVVVGEHQELGGVGVAVALDHAVLPGGLRRLGIGDEVVPGERDLEAQLLVGGLVVPDAAGVRAAVGHPVDLAVGRDRGGEALREPLDPGLVREVQEVLHGADRLEEGAGVVGEGVGHVLRAQPGLDEVVALGPARASLHRELVVGLRVVEGGDERLGRGDVVGVVVDQEGHRPSPAAAGVAAGDRDDRGGGTCSGQE